MGNIAEFGRDQLGFMTRCRDDFGDIVAADFAGWPVLVVSDMASIEKILVTDQQRFVKNSLVWRQTKALFGTGLLTSEGDLWRRQRKLAAPAFAGRQLASYAPSIVRIAEDALNRWHDGETFNAHPRMMALSFDVAIRTLFDSSAESDAVDRALDDIQRELESRITRPVLLPDWLPLPGHVRYLRAIRTIEGVIRTMIEERRASGFHGRRDVLSRLMAARDADQQGMSDDQLRDEVITLLLAGHETTALVLSWAIYLLGQHPAVADRIADEVRAVAADRVLELADVERLSLTEAAVLEAMRLFPPAWAIGRESVQPFEIGGFAMPAGVTIFISPWVIHRDPRYYDQPDAFLPDRWRRGLRQTLPRFAYMPFGGGPRVCIGQRFAIIETVLLLATMLRRFRFEWVGSHPIQPQPTFTLRPRGGVHVRIAGRK